MQKTANYNLNKPEATDPLRVEDFNENADVIDAAIKAVEDGLANKIGTAELAAAVGSGGSNCRIKWGSYTGTGTYGSASRNSVSVDFYPVLMVIGCKESVTAASWPSVYIRNCPSTHADSTPEAEITVIWGDRMVSWYQGNYSADYMQNNKKGLTYYYCVIGC